MYILTACSNQINFCKSTYTCGHAGKKNNGLLDTLWCVTPQLFSVCGWCLHCVGHCFYYCIFLNENFITEWKLHYQLLNISVLVLVTNGSSSHFPMHTFLIVLQFHCLSLVSYAESLVWYRFPINNVCTQWCVDEPLSQKAFWLSHFHINWFYSIYGNGKWLGINPGTFVPLLAHCRKLGSLNCRYCFVLLMPNKQNYILLNHSTTKKINGLFDSTRGSELQNCHAYFFLGRVCLYWYFMP